MKNVVAYIRVSTDGQCGDDKYGLDSQKEDIFKYCNDKGYNIVKWYKDEGESGADERPGFDEIVYGEISNPPIESVIVGKTDRVAREVELYFYYKMLLRKKKIELESVTEDFGRDGLYAKALEMFTIFAAEMERENIKKRTSGGRKIKASKGGYSGGRAPMGYKVVDKKLVINPEEAEIVKFIFERKFQGKTMLSTVDALNQEGFKTRNGKPFVISTVQSIWNNERTYRGEYKYGENGTWVKGEHEPILK